MQALLFFYLFYQNSQEDFRFCKLSCASCINNTHMERKITDERKNHKVIEKFFFVKFYEC